MYLLEHKPEGAQVQENSEISKTKSDLRKQEENFYPFWEIRFWIL